jgi:hypothetical protein
VSVEQPVTVEEEALSIELVEVNDGRCPSDVQCIWAGHASATLKISVSGSTPETIVIGTSAPPAMNLPFDADVGDYHFSLQHLQPSRTSASQPALAEYKVTVKIAHR